MDRTRRILVGLLAAYAASMTLIASQAAAESWFFRRFIAQITRNDRFPYFEDDALLKFALDFGMPLTYPEYWYLRIADLRDPIIVPAIVVFFLLGVGAALIRLPSRKIFDKD